MIMIDNPCQGCKDYCYKTDTCKSNGGCYTDDLEKKLAKLESALDKACENLHGYDLLFPSSLRCGKTKEQWKDYFLEED